MNTIAMIIGYWFLASLLTLSAWIVARELVGRSVRGQARMTGETSPGSVRTGGLSSPLPLSPPSREASGQ